MRTETGWLRRDQRVRFLALALLLAVISGLPAFGARGAEFQASPVASPVATMEVVEITGLVEQPGDLTVADLQQLPTETVEVTYETGSGPEQHTFTGTPLFGAIEQLGFQVPPDARNPLLRFYLVVIAKDGYQLVVSGGELDPNFGNAPMLLAWEQDGQPLMGEDGPVRLVVPDDRRGGRYVHGVVRIDVRAVEEIPATPTS